MPGSVRGISQWLAAECARVEGEVKKEGLLRLTLPFDERGSFLAEGVCQVTLLVHWLAVAQNRAFYSPFPPGCMVY